MGSLRLEGIRTVKLEPLVYLAHGVLEECKAAIEERKAELTFDKVAKTRMVYFGNAVTAVSYAEDILIEYDDLPIALFLMVEALHKLLVDWENREEGEPTEQMAQNILSELGAMAQAVLRPHGEEDQTLSAETKARARAIALAAALDQS
jgi:hypothetical protein